MTIDMSPEIQSTYDQIEEIGGGGGGTIFKAYHKRLQKEVVLKKIHSNVMDSVDIRIEADILKNLHHSYLPQVIDFLEIEDAVYTVMDFIPGKSFDQLLKEGTNFTFSQVLKYTRQICEAMAYLHKQDPPVMHGDIKPANIMLKPDDNICLIDFNISGFLSNGKMMTVGYSKGYAAPEQCQAVMALRENVTLRKSEDKGKAKFAEDGERTELLLEDVEKTVLLGSGGQETVLMGSDVHDTVLLSEEDQSEENENMIRSDRSEAAAGNRESLTMNNFTQIDLRADVFSIGATIYHLATGVRPSAQTEENGQIEELISGYSEGFSIVVAKAMEKDPDKRFKNAVEMLQAVNNIHIYDREYKALLLKQRLCFVSLILLIGISVSICLSGRQRMGQERLEIYEAMITELSDARDGSEEVFEELFTKACEYMPERLDAYYQKALYLAEREEYEESIDFIEANLINEPGFPGQDFSDSTYYLLADCYFELEKYEEAVVYYQAAIAINDRISQYYGDYAISLIYCGRIDQAEEVLRQGREKGMESDYVLLISAEIASAQGKYQEALEYFQECLGMTDNQRMKLRAYVLADKTIRKQGEEEEDLLRSVELLARAQTDLELSSQMLILERLVQDYVDLSTVTGDTDYDGKALEVLKKITQYGWDNYLTHINEAILYEKTGQLEEAGDVLSKLLEEDPENYVTYKRLAVLEIDIQKVKENRDRDYSRFLEYYNETIKLYEESKQETNDVEIQWLEQAYEQLVSGGWLEE